MESHALCLVLGADHAGGVVRGPEERIRPALEFFFFFFGRRGGSECCP